MESGSKWKCNWQGSSVCVWLTQWVKYKMTSQSTGVHTYMQKICTSNTAIKQSHSLICNTAHNEVIQGVDQWYISLMIDEFLLSHSIHYYHTANPKFYVIIHLLNIFTLLGMDVLATHIFLPEPHHSNNMTLSSIVDTFIFKLNIICWNKMDIHYSKSPCPKEWQNICLSSIMLLLNLPSSL